MSFTLLDLHILFLSSAYFAALQMTHSSLVCFYYTQINYNTNSIKGYIDREILLILNLQSKSRITAHTLLFLSTPSLKIIFGNTK